MWKLTLLLSLMLMDTVPTGEDFVPSNIGQAVAFACVVAGDKGPPPFAEVQVFVKWDVTNSNWDYKPKVARYTVEQGGVFKAGEECREWYERVMAKLQEASKEVKK